MEPYLDAALLGGAKLDREHLDLLKRTFTLSYSESTTVQQRPAVAFLDGRLHEVHLANKNVRLEVGGVELFQRNRIAVITSLARMEEVVLFSGSNYYFETIGVRVTAPKFWKTQGSIGLFSREGLEAEFEKLGPYEFAPDEITGKES